MIDDTIEDAVNSKNIPVLNRLEDEQNKGEKWQRKKRNLKIVNSLE